MTFARVGNLLERSQLVLPPAQTAGIVLPETSAGTGSDHSLPSNLNNNWCSPPPSRKNDIAFRLNANTSTSRLFNVSAKYTALFVLFTNTYFGTK